jgi:uncharacterized protein DUF1707/cell wall-active antibiotic response 4TMS protein YvqF
MRVSNDDRERVAKVLHDAMAEGRITVNELEERLDTVYAAKTFGDLQPVTADLPVGQTRAPAVPQSVPQPPVPASGRVGGRGTSSTAIAIMSGADRKGVWTVPPTFTAFAMMGGVELDLTQARFEDAETTIQAFAIMGGVDIYVPEDVEVQVNGFGFMGAFENRVRENTAPPGAPLVKINGFALMAGVEVKRRKPSKRDRRELEE